MNNGSLLVITWSLFFILSLSAAHAAEKAVISYSSRTYAFLPAQIAVVKGFFKDENLEPLLIQMRSQVTVPAL
jgi:ABC-type nitrate/sulfonate/bicarbonate transport system substrate-binding protein